MRNGTIVQQEEHLQSQPYTTGSTTYIHVSVFIFTIVLSSSCQQLHRLPHNIGQEGIIQDTFASNFICTE
jgi:hypothetical protein